MPPAAEQQSIIIPFVITPPAVKLPITAAPTIISTIKTAPPNTIPVMMPFFRRIFAAAKVPAKQPPQSAAPESAFSPADERSSFSEAHENITDSRKNVPMQASA